jgi:hypothetical protein
VTTANFETNSVDYCHAECCEAWLMVSYNSSNLSQLSYNFSGTPFVTNCCLMEEQVVCIKHEFKVHALENWLFVVHCVPDRRCSKCDRYEHYRRNLKSPFPVYSLSKNSEISLIMYVGFKNSFQKKRPVSSFTTSLKSSYL